MTYRLRITPAIADEYEVRDLAENYVGEHNAYAKIEGSGDYEFTRGELNEIFEDASLYSDSNGPGESLTFGQRQAYRRLKRNALALLWRSNQQS